MLIDASLREPLAGIGKPEQLKYGAQGSWSRRITDEHRLVYLVDGDDLVILQARYHYRPQRDPPDCIDGLPFPDRCDVARAMDFE